MMLTLRGVAAAGGTAVLLGVLINTTLSRRGPRG